MKNKTKSIILLCITICFLLFNVVLLLLIQLHKNELNNVRHELEHLESIEFMFDEYKRITINRFKYEQYNIGNSSIYVGSNEANIIPIFSVV